MTQRYLARCDATVHVGVLPLDFFPDQRMEKVLCNGMRVEVGSDEVVDKDDIDFGLCSLVADG